MAKAYGESEDSRNRDLCGFTLDSGYYRTSYAFG